MAKSAHLYVRMEPDVKEQAESILSALGIPASNAVNMFYQQIILHNGIPFDVVLPSQDLPDISKMTTEELDSELEKGYADMTEGRTAPADQVFDQLHQKYGI